MPLPRTRHRDRIYSKCVQRSKSLSLVRSHLDAFVRFSCEIAKQQAQCVAAMKQENTPQINYDHIVDFLRLHDTFYFFCRNSIPVIDGLADHLRPKDIYFTFSKLEFMERGSYVSICIKYTRIHSCLYICTEREIEVER